MSGEPAAGGGLGSARYRPLYLVVLALWVISPFLTHEPPQDAIPMVTAGSLVGHHQSLVYLGRNATNVYDLQPGFRRAACRFYPSRAQCDKEATAFVSTPLSLPLVVGLSHLGRAAPLVLQVLAGLALVGGMVILWARLSPAGDHAPALLVATAVLATPLALTTVGLGQTSPLLFLLAVIPAAWLSSPARRGMWAGLLAVSIAIKGFPGVMLAVLALARRWRLLVLVVGALALLSALALLVVSPALVTDFLRSSRALTSHGATAPNNGSLEAALFQSGLAPGLSSAGAWLIRLALVVPVVRLVLRLRDVDAQWAAAWLAILIFFPQVWNHYLFVPPGAVGVLVATRADRGRYLWMVPAVAAGSALVVAGPWPSSAIIQSGLLLGALAALFVLARRPDSLLLDPPRQPSHAHSA